jgi:REP element-mobilizing transposase RayT
MLSINGMPDHLLVLIGMRPSQSLSDLMRDIKVNSSKWVNENKFANHNFAWREGYGAFSYKKSDIDTVATYIQNQEIHHKKIIFTDEYRSLLNEFEIEYDKKYLFTEPI